MCVHAGTCAGALEARRGRCSHWTAGSRQFRTAWHGCWEESQILCRNLCVGSLVLWNVTFRGRLFNVAWYFWEAFKLLASSRIVPFYWLTRGGLYCFQSGVMIKKVQMGWVILLLINHSFLSSSIQQEIRLHSIKKKVWLWLTSRTAIIFPSHGK